MIVNFKISSCKQISSTLRKCLRYFLEAYRSSISRFITKDWKYSSHDGHHLSLSGVVDALSILEYLGRVLIELNLPHLLDTVILRVKELYPPYPHLTFLEYKLACLQKKVKRDELIGSLDQIISRDPHNIELQLERVKKLSETGQTTRAMTLCLALREEHPNDPELLHELGKLHEKENNYEVAADLQLKALELSTQKAILPFELISLIIE